MDILFDDKTVVVTGAASGIGRSISTMFAASGAHVCILDYDREAGQTVCEEIEGRGESCSFYFCDVANQEDVHRTFQEITSERSRIDILVNNAGIAHVGKLQDTSEEEFDRIYEVNVKGVYNCMHAVIEQMVRQGGGVILNMASVISSVGIEDRFAYSMSKGTVLTMTRSEIGRAHV